MSGIYLHIPFCKKACHYCNFHFSTSTQYLQDFVKALLKEIVLQSSYLHEPVSTVYFGGGTPSLLPIDSLREILYSLRKNFTIEDDAEVTLEANPDDIDLIKLEQWKEAGVNRLSIGVQSFFDEDLAWMNRAHNALQARDCIAMAQAAGFHNLTVDLIYGTPTLSDEQWKYNVNTAIELNIPHLSCYALTVEPKTALEKMIRRHTIAAVDADKQARHFELLMQWMQEAGFEHYEISNFAKKGYRSRHNSSYWQGRHYLGLGPSAHSFNGKSRQWNISNNALYLQNINNDTVPFDCEILTVAQQVNEYIMTALRTLEGISLLKITNEFGGTLSEKIVKDANTYILNGHLELNDEFLKTTRSGKLLADGIAADLFVEERELGNG